MRIISSIFSVRISFILTLALAVLVFSCKPKTNSSAAESNAVVNSSSAKTQALLLTQPSEYDASDKDKITGEYVSKKKITIPKNLATQSKWIMFEGPVLENDLVAYRYYADSRHRFDIYGKLVTDLVMDTVSWKYHDIMDWGSDILKVGNSLGMGSPAIYYQDSLYTLADCEKKEIEVMESGENRSMIRTTFTGLTIENEKFDLIQDWSISAGEAWSEIKLKVVNGSLPKGMRFATGFVKHIPEIVEGKTDDMFYAMNWGKQSFHKEDLGMAILANLKDRPTPIMDDMSHAYYFENAEKEVTYQFISVWERDLNGVKNQEGFKQLIEKASLSLR